MSMFENVSFIKIMGGIFDKETDLPIYVNEKHKPRFCLLYGKNGTGKSTISRAFAKLRDDSENKIYTAELLDKNGNVLLLDETERKSIYVFNEEFIERNIRIYEDGLNAIVVIGAEKDIDDKIKELTPEFNKRKLDYNAQKAKCDQYSDPKNKLSPGYYQEQIVNSLKGDANWAGRDAYIRGNKRNSSVNIKTYEQFVNLSTSKTRDDLIVEYDQVKREFESAKIGDRTIPIPVLTSYPFNDIEENVRILLAEKIEKPILTDREKYLFSLLDKAQGVQHLQNIKAFFNDAAHTKCPYCFQNVSEEYASELVRSIEKILSKKAEEHQEKLRKLNAITYEFDATAYKELDSKTITRCQETLLAVNKAAEKINEALLEKIGNVYESILLPSIGLKDRFNDFVSALKELEKERISFNTKATNPKPIMQKLNEINGFIAKYDIEESYKALQKQVIEKEKEDAVLAKMQAQMQDLKGQLDDLEEKKKQVCIAMDAINDDLQYIFFSKDRLRIDYSEGKYILFSHGKPVEPNNVSVGERNVIGLCYFFNRIMENKNESAVYNLPYLLIIDDPVSSFDMENRIGILSYLKYELNKFALGNAETRFLIMTHDLQTLFDCNKFVGEILEKCSGRFNGQVGQNKKCVNVLELQNLKIVNSNLLGRHEYTSLLEITYDYAVEGTDKYSMSIGNIMRKVLEAFGTFTYRKGIEALSTDENILSCLEQPYRKYFENLMYRLVLHGGSHMEDKTKTLTDMNFFDYISDGEKQRTAMDMLCFLYKLNPKHILAHLTNREGAEEQIENWCKDNIEI